MIFSQFIVVIVIIISLALILIGWCGLGAQLLSQPAAARITLRGRRRLANPPFELQKNGFSILDQYIIIMVLVVIVHIDIKISGLGAC